jgi:hypothetical protein
MAGAKTNRKNAFKEQDAMRLADLARSHNLPLRKSGIVYRFEDFTAYGLDQALGYAEGYDRAVDRWKNAAKGLDGTSSGADGDSRSGANKAS